jgi:hypothetical protein
MKCPVVVLHRLWVLAVGASLSCCVVLPALAQDTDDGGKTAYKFMGSWYRQDGGAHAVDLNLRANRGPHAVWLGFYQDNMNFQQLRGGYEYTQQKGLLQAVWSLQAASRDSSAAQ